MPTFFLIFHMIPLLFRYKMYLCLKSLYPEEFLVPCYDMDVCWHTHQIQPILYQNETKAILGHVLPHDDSVNDRTPGSKLNNSEEITRKLWKKTFNQDFSRPGSMYRGMPPNGRLFSLNDSAFQNDLLMGESYSIDFEDLIWVAANSSQAEKYTNKGHLYLKICMITRPYELGGWERSIGNFTFSQTINSEDPSLSHHHVR